MGAIAGFTIFLGLPIARMKSASPKFKGMLNAAAAGILLFLLVEVLKHAMEATEENFLGSLAGEVPLMTGILYVALLIGGVAIGLLGLVWFEERFIKNKLKNNSKHPEFDAKRVAMMIAIGIGLHNFSEGLAIGQSYAGGAISLAFLLVIGFGLHNATEGFGIAAPLSGSRPSWKFLALAGLIAGGPTFLGTIIGSVWVSPAISAFFLALAAGAIIYVIKELLYHGRIKGEGIAVMGFLLLGFFIGFGTDLIIEFASTV
ncbi:MAG TPA: ZIP family metal transporter [Candidatus Nanoarchaeia archaeon]|nr:ZIP family metal transporter [Candidatus Nanoarchaeia archaeon]